MNERIRLLARQADPGYTGNNEAGLGASLVGNDAIEKFAQLIVRECIDLLPEDSHNKDMVHTSWVIKEYFGIKE